MLATPYKNPSSGSIHNRAGVPERFPSEKKRYLSKEHAKKAEGLGVWSPGPGAYNPELNAFGNSSVARVKTAPAFSFGYSQRDKSEKVRYLSPEHARTNNFGVCSPGPSYNHRVTRSGGSYLGDSPGFKFGQSRRAGKFKEKAPGPGAYTNQPSMGKQVHSKKESSNAYTFGRCDRGGGEKTRFISEKHSKILHGVNSPGPCEYSPLRNNRGLQFGDAPKYSFHGVSEIASTKYIKQVRNMPGPGKYLGTSSIGGQVDSNKKNAPTFSFGTSDRNKAAKKMFLSHEHSQENYGQGSPGPAAYSAYSSFGRQVSNRTATAPAYTLGGP